MRNEPSAPSVPPTRGFASLITLVSDVSQELAALEQPVAAQPPRPVEPPQQVEPARPPAVPIEPVPPGSRGFASLITLVSDVSKELAALEQPLVDPPRPPRPQPVRIKPAPPPPIRPSVAAAPRSAYVSPKGVPNKGSSRVSAPTKERGPWFSLAIVFALGGLAVGLRHCIG